ncbi:FG-GAP-like repeat-containing protein [Isosphaeraceae bacterium EP7]
MDVESTVETPRATPKMTTRARTRTLIATTLLTLVGLTVAGVWVSSRRDRAFRADLAEARKAMDDGRFAMARQTLNGLADGGSDDPELFLLLGYCEQARGKPPAALAAWSRIGADTPQASEASFRSGQVEQEAGRLAAAEELFRKAIDLPGTFRDQGRNALARLLRLEGREDEARRVDLDGVDASTDPTSLAKLLHTQDILPFPIEGARRYFDRSAARAPDDDRVRLGRARLAILTGDFDEATRLLDANLARAPDDPPTLKASLDLAVAANRPELAKRALGRLTSLEPRDQARLRAWIAASQGDRAAEADALRAQVAAGPVEARSLDRLAELEDQAGRPDEAAKIRTRKADLDRTGREYADALAAPGLDPASKEQAVTLGRLASKLGRALDLACWQAVAEGRPLDLSKFKGSPAVSTGPLLSMLERAKSVEVVADVVQPARFEDEAERAGLRFGQISGSTGRGLIPPVTSSGGVGLIDYDADGHLDVYLVQGGTFPSGTTGPSGGDRLFRNKGDGTFEDATARSGIEAMPRGYGHGVAVADYDNDGHADLFITRWRSYALYRNKGDGTFEDATARLGLGGDRDWPTSAAFADLDGDGDLDLYVCHYLKWDENSTLPCSDPNDPSVYACNPRDFPALADHLFRNDGSKFVDVTAEAGLVDDDGRGLGVLAADLDDDGKTDLFVANDTTANYFWRNLGGLKFEESAVASGLASSASGGFKAGMGVACGDLDGDGILDLAVTNFYNESTTFYQNLGGGLFADRTSALGLAAPTRFVLGFGLALPDVNNDGHLDLMQANGHVFDGRPQFPWKMPAQLLLGTPRGTLLAPGAASGAPFSVPHIARGLAAGDLDNDGSIDAVLVCQDEPAVYLHNNGGANRSITLALRGVKSNRDGVGARVSVRVGDRTLVAARIGGGSYQSADDPRLHFGLGAADHADSAEVRWPSGRLDRIGRLEAGRGYLLTEGSDTPRPLDGREHTTDPRP